MNTPRANQKVPPGLAWTRLMVIWSIIFRPFIPQESVGAKMGFWHLERMPRRPSPPDLQALMKMAFPQDSQHPQYGFLPYTSKPTLAQSIFLIITEQLTWLSNTPDRLYCYILNRIVLHRKETRSQKAPCISKTVWNQIWITEQRPVFKTWLLFSF